MHQNVHANTETQHSRDDAKAHKILRRIVAREQVSTVDLCKVAQSIDQRQRNSSHFRVKVTKRRTCIRQRGGVGSPESGGHKNQENVAGGEVVDCADEDGCDERECEPASNDQTPVLRDLISENASNGCADEGHGVDGDRHVLGLDGAGVAEALDEGGVEVGEGGGTDNDLMELLDVGVRMTVEMDLPCIRG